MTLAPLYQWTDLCRPTVIVAHKVHKWVRLMVPFFSCGTVRSTFQCFESLTNRDKASRSVPAWLLRVWDSSVWCLQQQELIWRVMNSVSKTLQCLGVCGTSLAKNYRRGNPFLALILRHSRPRKTNMTCFPSFVDGSLGGDGLIGFWDMVLLWNPGWHGAWYFWVLWYLPTPHWD